MTPKQKSLEQKIINTICGVTICGALGGLIAGGLYGTFGSSEKKYLPSIEEYRKVEQHEETPKKIEAASGIRYIQVYTQTRPRPVAADLSWCDKYPLSPSCP